MVDGSVYRRVDPAEKRRIRKFAREWLKRNRDSDGTATAAANGDLPVPQDCQARCEAIAQPLPQSARE